MDVLITRTRLGGVDGGGVLDDVVDESGEPGGVFLELGGGVGLGGRAAASEHVRDADEGGAKGGKHGLLV